MPNALARAASDRPVWPRPTISSVCPASGRTVRARSQCRAALSARSPGISRVKCRKPPRTYSAIMSAATPAALVTVTRVGVPRAEMVDADAAIATQRGPFSCRRPPRAGRDRDRTGRCRARQARSRPSPRAGRGTRAGGGLHLREAPAISAIIGPGRRCAGRGGWAQAWVGSVRRVRRSAKRVSGAAGGRAWPRWRRGGARAGAVP
jgi:hypothetical protein